MEVQVQPDHVDVAVKTLPHFHGLELPAYETDLAAGMDIAAAIDAPMTIAPGSRGLVPTGLAMAIPGGYEIQVRPRSGLALKKGVTCLNTPGTIDADYRGELKVILANLGDEPLEIERGMRIAQIVLSKVPMIRWQPVDNLPPTERGTGGFGSTGV